MMRRETFEIRYYDTYFYASVIKNVLYDRFGYLRTISELFEDGGELEFCAAFQKDTALHRFAWFSIEMILFEDLSSDQLEDVILSEDT